MSAKLYCDDSLRFAAWCGNLCLNSYVGICNCGDKSFDFSDDNVGLVCISNEDCFKDRSGKSLKHHLTHFYLNQLNVLSLN